MPKVAPFISLAFIKLERDPPLPLHRQLYDALRERILSGQLKPNDRLPSTRALAEDLEVSRTTVLQAYDQLISEGYIQSLVGSGTRVTETLPELNQPIPAASILVEQPLKAPRLSKKAQSTLEVYQPQLKTNPFFSPTKEAKAFNPACPDLTAFPHKLWEKSLLAAWREQQQQMGYQSSFSVGYEPLKEILADYTHKARGIRCTPEQIIITNGTQQALSTISSVLLEKDDSVWVENPGHKGSHVIFRSSMANVVPVSVGEDGIDLEEGIKKAKDARMIYIIPSHQHPTGVTMSLSGRLKLLQWAKDNDVWIVEDDYGSEFRYAGAPIEALQGLDNSGNVIYLMTFSKVLFPALRLGYMVVPEQLIQPMKAAQECLGRSLNLLQQVSLYKFIEQGHFSRHIRKMRTLYGKRQKYLVKHLSQLNNHLSCKPHDAGLHLVAYLKQEQDEIISQKLLEKGVIAPPLSSFALEPLKQQGLVLGFTAPEKELREGVTTLKEILEHPT